MNLTAGHPRRWQTVEAILKKIASTLAVVAGLSLAATAAQAEIKVGFVTALSGAGASIGIPYEKGIKAAFEYQSEVGGEKITLISLDDGSDPSAASRAARKLVEEEHVDLLIGSAQATSTIAMVAVANELHVPMIAISPINVTPAKDGERWAIAMPQTPALMVKVIAKRMQRDGIKTVGYIGYNDAWGDFVYDGAKAAEADGGPKVTTNERYSRTDTSVTGQVLKVLASRPDAFIDGGSGTQGALPLIELRKRGFKGPFYGTPSVLNADFIRVGGAAVEGIQVSAGPVVVTSQLPDDHFAKKPGMAFHEAYAKVNNGEQVTDGFSGYSFDGWLVFLDAAEKALKEEKPGTQAFRKALNDAIFTTKDLPGVHAVYNFTPASSYGVDERSLVVVKLVEGKWVYQP
ncbi:amino acid/amide ABC transporter substrate-binding protein (HAAT family) [Breoghania corrubedonensis]|uniref:Amino acid/amide ABC transporter substrate-binding protein (HAAT family) n=1 Tax=Breoghania corrubedonensis TaxID=665038 RepID=A0A2T5UYQ4_9HYPH|nr:amino acid/amide ABC transporter substrate-binding protein (HAAT family) [Breoghania corrubedonensis]